MGLLDFLKKQPNAIEHAVPSELPSLTSGNAIVSASEQLLIEVSTDLPCNNSIRLPIAEIASFGGGLASLLPSLRTITQTVSTSGTGLFQLANAGVGDALKVAKDGSLWGALKTSAGSSKMAKFVGAGPISTTTKTVAAINPTMLVMAVALATIEKKLGDIADIRFLESNQEKYKAFGDYWLVLAESYYNHNDYAKCLEAIQQYESLGIRIFRDDREYAKVLPLAIISAGEAYNGEEYIHTAERFADAILANTDDNYEWSLRYFAAQTYINLYAMTKQEAYLLKAYEIALDNANYLVGKQKSLNNEYLVDVVEQTIPKDATESEKKEIGDFNKQLQEDRKLALPPVYEPLLLNCELLFSLADQVKLDDTQKATVDEILHENGSCLFLIPTLDSKYYLLNTPSIPDYSSISVSFNGKALTLPAKYVTRDASIMATVTVPGSNEPVMFDDWTLVKTDRPEKDSFDSYTATFKSTKAEKHQYVLDSSIVIDVVAKKGGSVATVSLEYSTANTKTDFWTNIAFWNSGIGFTRVK